MCNSEMQLSAVRIFAANQRTNEMLIERMEDSVWIETPPGRVRTIAAIFTHVHNVRVKWVRLSAPHLGVPAQLKAARCTREEARVALAESAGRCEEMLGGTGGVETFVRDGWAKPWPVGPEMLCYMVAHEAHHRGQVCMLAHQLGCRLPDEVTAGMWSWERMWR